MEHEPDPGPIDARLLSYLRAKLGPQVIFARRPARMTGGYDTSVYAFRLRAAPPPFSADLVLRRFTAASQKDRAHREAAIQNALADQGYPVPRVIDLCTNAAILGGHFTIMERAPGRTMLELLDNPSIVWRAPGLLAEAHARLHALDPRVVAQALEAAGVAALPCGSEPWLADLQRRSQRPELQTLAPALAWLETHQPPRATRMAILHCDFHPANILVDHGAVSGVIDWANVTFGDPAADVAATRVLLTLAPVEAARWLRPVLIPVRRWLAWRYTRAYRRRSRLSLRSVRYYEAMRCYSSLVAVAERRLAVRAGTPPERETYPWDTPDALARLAGRFRSITGIPPILPGP